MGQDSNDDWKEPFLEREITTTHGKLVWTKNSTTKVSFSTYDPYNSTRVVRVSDVAELTEALAKLAGDTHLIIESGVYEPPNPLPIKSYAGSKVRLTISPAVGGAVEFIGVSHIQVPADLSLELQRLRFSSEAELTVTGASKLVIDSCHFEHLSLLWEVSSGSLRIVNSVFIKGARLLVSSDDEAQVSLMNNTWSGGKSPALDLVGAGRVQLVLGNNIFSGQGAKALHAKDGFNVMLSGRNNLFHGWETIGLDGEERLMKNRTAYPMLKENGWSLMEKSPAINAGAALGDSVSGDIEGDYRGLRPDIGADEY